MSWFEKKKIFLKNKASQEYKLIKIRKLRRTFQVAFLFLLNPFIILGGFGIISFELFKKYFQNMNVVFPVMNCYACPAAAFACPIGAMGNLFEAGVVPFCVLGIFVVVGVLVGKMFCGWICPFGLIQELFHKIPGKKIKLPKFTGYFKYGFLIITVVLIPIFWGTSAGTGTPSEAFFCNICPTAALEATIPVQIQLVAEGQLSLHVFFINLLTGVKFWILIGFIFLFIISKRPFCKVMCPIGAIFGLFNFISFFKMKVDPAKCTSCNKCEKECPVDHAINDSCSSPECIRCLECQYISCNFDAVESNLMLKTPVTSLQMTKELMKNGDS
ncbi:MAG: 4Fe-4S binding protein [Candidatus Heimdallarchaeota archaeon]|nr:4Fe-4S binding protein [Candidatus Heimdallarchaeota archaeon]